MSKRIALTFDDVPSYAALNNNPTAVITETVREYGGKATFFVVGSALRKNGPEILYKALEYGFELANHTDTHRNLTKLTCGETESEILKLQDAVYRQFGVNMKYMRPPGLNVNGDVFSVTERLGMPVIFGSRGNADLSDWNPETTPEHIKTRCLNGAYDGQIVLMHGYSQATASVLGEICAELSEAGYSFVTLSELFDSHKSGKLPCDRPIYDIQSAYNENGRED